MPSALTNSIEPESDTIAINVNAKAINTKPIMIDIFLPTLFDKPENNKNVTIDTTDKTVAIVEYIVESPTTFLKYNEPNVSNALNDINHKKIAIKIMMKFLLSFLLITFVSSLISSNVSDRLSPYITSSLVSSTILFSLIVTINTINTITKTAVHTINGQITLSWISASEESAFNLKIENIPKTVANTPPKYPIRLIIPFAALLNGLGVTSGIKATAGER